MNIPIDFDEAELSLPGEKEVRNAVKICCGRCCTACETPVEYALRKSQLDLADLLNIAVERELSEKEREAVNEVYYKGVSPGDFAEERGISPSAVYCLLTSAKQRLKNALYYVMLYLDGYEGKEKEGRVYESLAVNRARGARAPEIGQRLRNCRLSAGVSLQKAATVSGLEKGAVYRFEQGDSQPVFNKLYALCAAYGIKPEKLFAEDENEQS